MASYTRPTHYPYSFKAFLDVPRRLFYPPPAKVKIGRVRSMSLTPLFEVKLGDVLDGQHLPPLSKKDFEEYLLFVEHSPENLYFIQWLRGYVQAYNVWAQSGKPHSGQLALSWSRAKQTFFADDAHFKLNLPTSLLEGLAKTPDASQQTSMAPESQQPSSAPMSQQPSQSSHDYSVRPSYPSPSAFSQVEHEVEDMLRESLNRFVCGSCGNSGRARGLFGIALGVITLAVGLAPVLLSILEGRGGRALRVAAIPLFWFGAWVTIMSLHGVCIVIFLFGDARQLYPYELARPKITSPICKPQVITITSPEDTEKSGDPANKSHLYVDLEQGNMGSCSSASTFGKQSQQHIASVASSTLDRDSRARPLSGDLASPQTIASPTSVQGLISQPQNGAEEIELSPSVHRWSFDFDALPPLAPNAPVGTNLETWDEPGQKGVQTQSFNAAPTFGPLTRVLSPIVTRAQWEIVIRSAIMAVFVAAILGAICLAVPARR